MEGIIIEKLSNSSWSKYSNLEKLSVFQKPSWLESIASEKIKTLFLEFQKDNIAIAIISGLVVSTRLGVYLHFYAGITPTTTPFANEDFRSCYEKLRLFARKNNYYRIICGCYDYSFLFKDFPLGYHTFERPEFILSPINHEPKTDYSSQIRKNLKKARKETLEFIISDKLEYLETLKALLKETYDRRVAKKSEKYNPLFLKYMTFGSLEAMLSSGDGKIALCKGNESVHTICYILLGHNQAQIFLVGNSIESIKKGIATHTYDQIINMFKTQGLASLNFGGTSTKEGGEGLTRFKLSLGCQEKVLYGATTNFLTMPYVLINPILNLIRTIKKALHKN